MVSELSDREPTIGETRERMQRVRVGVTGLAAVILVVALVSAVASSLRQSATDSAIAARPDVVPTLNMVEEKSEPLAQLGVAPDAKDMTPPPPQKNPN
jgi:hypothetical protein